LFDFFSVKTIRHIIKNTAKPRRDKASIALLRNIPRKADPVRMDSIPLKTALIDNVNTAHRKNTPNSWADLLIRFFIMILF
jgi:hypothetical protein